MSTPVKQNRKTNRNKTGSPVVSAKKARPSTVSDRCPLGYLLFLPPTLATSASSGSLADTDIVSFDTEESRDSPVATYTADKIPVFKDPNFVHSSLGSAGNKKTRTWKNLKQIVAAERSLPWQPDDVTYGMIEAPPSFKPAMKYSDLSGLPAKYTDPQTKLRYATTEEYARVRLMPSDLVTGCLALRKASAPV